MTQKNFLRDSISKITRRSQTNGPRVGQERIATTQPKSAVGSSAQLASPRKEIATILVMGRSGSGKTQFIRTICSTPEGHRAKTLEVQSYPFTLFNKDFRLVDTPGFDNVDISDIKILTKVAQHVLNRPDRGITGIIFIHPAGDMLQSKTLQQNLGALLTLFLGEREVHRLTVLVTPGNTQGLGLQAAADQFRQYDSPIFKKLRQGAAIRPITRHRGRMDNVLHCYCMLPSIAPPIRHFDPTQLTGFMEQNFGYYETESVSSIVADYKQRIAELQSPPDPQLPISEICHLRKERDRIQGLYIDLQNSNMVLQRQFHQLQKEHASLQTQAQTESTYDWKQLGENLCDLNTLLKQVGQSISDYLSDLYIRITFNKKPEDVTTLDARDMPQLISWLGYDEHAAGEDSLISSSDGSTGLDAETFFDFSIRSHLCAYLIRSIFLPFHPLLEPSESDWLTNMYKKIRQQESQYMAGRWRSTTFNSITESKGSSAVDERITKLARDFILECLNPLVVHFFGRVPDNLKWDKQYREQIYQLFEIAYKWNVRLKGEVILQGDFEQIAPISRSIFDGTQMKDFDSSSQPRGYQARTVLATLAFGITMHEAVGGGKPPRSTIVHKAVVATEGYYLS
ncbi:unnamed protein product [Rhizoctonia solani]|uniref:G domain-containing protein n=1 Tax=Rhizoctonia solani TaxID=456999 RepID=A0A8H3GPG8_9AGAM|nr:unnamed protein product [Rhizoctonia solani]